MLFSSRLMPWGLSAECIHDPTAAPQGGTAARAGFNYPRNECYPKAMALGGEKLPPHSAEALKLDPGRQEDLGTF